MEVFLSHMQYSCGTAMSIAMPRDDCLIVSGFSLVPMHT